MLAALRAPFLLMTAYANPGVYCRRAKKPAGAAVRAAFSTGGLSITTGVLSYKHDGMALRSIDRVADKVRILLNVYLRALIVAQGNLQRDSLELIASDLFQRGILLCGKREW